LFAIYLNIQREKHCRVCEDALQPGSKNRRRNPSALIQYRGKNILIDCGILIIYFSNLTVGKTFREAMVDVIVKHKITSLDAIVITHGHSDAFLGLDDLREFTEKATNPIPVFIRKPDVPIISSCFPYLFDVSKATGSGYVSSIKFEVFEENEPFEVLGS
jgi:phosphoribosyl 1,2-cyclic phosphodiesterase